MNEIICGEIEKTYVITPDGKCINRKKGNEVSFPLDKKGYKKTRLWCPALSKNKDKRLPFRLHRLVGMFYLKDFNPALQINHKNGIKTDNRIENLEMVTNQYNAWHGWNVLDSTKRRQKISDIQTGRKLSEETIKKISQAKTGIASVKKHTEESRAKMSKVRSAYWARKRLEQNALL